MMTRALYRAFIKAVYVILVVGLGRYPLAAQEDNAARARAKSLAEGPVGAAMRELSPEDEYFIGRAVAASLLANYRIYSRNINLTRYLNKICLSLVVNSPQPQLYRGYHVAILDSVEINAFATSAGYIFVTRGLLSRVTSEDTLAAVIAHEVAHIQSHHSIKAIRASRLSQALEEASRTEDAAKTMEEFDESIEDIMSVMTRRGYSQAQEFEADSMALSLLASAGYDPAALIEILRILSRDQPSSPGGFNSTHPSPDQRLAHVERQVGQYRVRNTRSFRAARFKSLL